MWNEPMAPPAALEATSQLESDPPIAATQGGTCLNCGTLLTDAFCAHCGQRAGDARLSVRDIAHEAVAEHLGLDSKVARTLVTLLRHPGRLTIEFLSGRRVRYVALRRGGVLPIASGQRKAHHEGGENQDRKPQGSALQRDVGRALL